MSGITLVLTICSVIIAGAHIALVNGEAARNRPVNLHSRNPSGGFGSWGSCYSCDDCDGMIITKQEFCEVNLQYQGCVTYTELDLTRLERRVVRGCAARLTSCEELQKKNPLILSCDQCPDDNCNAPILKNSKK